jgi:bisphosphoglycerate-independent phosphoglycerate mutase (AlkP superfamily)
MRLLDIAPTLLDLAGLEIPAAMQGRSLQIIASAQDA